MSSYTLTRSDGCVVTGTLVDGKVDGAVTVKYPDGNTESVKYYSMNVPVGIHTMWNEDGEVLTTIEYENGLAVKENGEPIHYPEEFLAAHGND